jgi:hypothetical protein
MNDNEPHYPRADDAVYQTMPETKVCDGCDLNGASCVPFMERLINTKRRGTLCGRNIWKRIA